MEVDGKIGISKIRVVGLKTHKDWGGTEILVLVEHTEKNTENKKNYSH
jgi:hypothetical protein